MLCQVCVQAIDGYNTEDIRSNGGRTLVRSNHHKSMESLRSSVAINCRVCAQFYHQLSERERDLLNQSNRRCMSTMEVGLLSPGENIWQEYLGKRGSPDSLSTMQKSVVTSRNNYCLTELRMSFNRDGTSSRYGVHHLDLVTRNDIFLRRTFELQTRNDSIELDGFASSTASEQSMSVARNWLDNCIANHEKCAIDSIGWVPTRLLDLGKDVNCPLRLIEGSKLSGKCQYITLSHCWGNQDLLQLSHDTESSLQTGISIEDLPLTFQHAVKVVRHLAMRYIWIDSLCIFQDRNDKSD